jgi:molecular chaperone HscA
MQVIEISEPLSSNQKAVQEIAVGIDFGTTNSLVAIAKNKAPHIITDNKNSSLIPSIIKFREGEFIVGDNSETVDTIRSVKRLFGKKLDDIKNNPALFALVRDHLDLNSQVLRIKFSDKSLTIPELAAQIFLYLKKQATCYLNAEVKKAVITVPAHFNDAARGEVMLAARIAGFDVLRLIAEPTAAAYAYGLNKRSTGRYLVYDLGGGTFDVSILNMQVGIFQVIATAGDNILGGDDIDYLVLQYFCDKYKLPESKELIQLAKQAKETLSSREEYNTKFQGRTLELNREDFELLILPLIKRTLVIAREALESVGNPDIAGIVLVGGSTRIPLIRKMLEKTFDATIFSDVDPDEVVALGAALQAENLTTNERGSLLIDVVPLSLGIELNGGLTEKIILRNSPIPISITKEYTTYVDNQTAMKLHILQGEREMVKDCRSLAQFELALPPMKAGAIRTEVTFSIDADGILSVLALEKNSGTSHNVEVKPTYGLSPDEVTRILENAYQNAAVDHHNKLLQETIMHSQSMVYNIEAAIEEMPNLLTNDEMDKIYNAINTLKKSIETNDREYIIECDKAFEEVTARFANERLNSTISSLLKGKHIKEV